MIPYFSTTATKNSEPSITAFREGSHHGSGRAVDIGNEGIAASLLPQVATDEKVVELEIDELILDVCVAGQSNRYVWNYDLGSEHE